jgi:hypothetical protein
VWLWVCVTKSVSQNRRQAMARVFERGFMYSIALATFVAALAATLSPSSRYAGPREALAGWHAAVTGLCVPLVVAAQPADTTRPASVFIEYTTVLVLCTQVINVVALVINGPGVGQTDNVPVKPLDETFGYAERTDITFFLLWFATAVTTTLAAVFHLSGA